MDEVRAEVRRIALETIAVWQRHNVPAATCAEGLGFDRNNEDGTRVQWDDLVDLLAIRIREINAVPT